MILAEHFPQNGPLHFQANNIPAHIVPMNYSTIHDVFPRKYTNDIKLHATLL